MTFTKEHLQKLAAKGKGGLAGWAKKQLGRAGNTKARIMTHAHRKKSRSSNISGGEMAKRRSRHRSSASGGASVANIAVGGLLYGAAGANIPSIQAVSPLVRGLIGYYIATKTSGVAKGVGIAAVAVETKNLGAGLSVGGLMGGAGNGIGGYL